MIPASHLGFWLNGPSKKSWYYHEFNGTNTQLYIDNYFGAVAAGWVSLAGFSVLGYFASRQENDLAPEGREDKS